MWNAVFSQKMPVTVGWMLIAAILPCPAPVYAQNTSPVGSPARILHFPKDRSLGRITIQDESIKRQIKDFHHWVDGEWYENSDTLGEAMGDVAIPAGKKVQLRINPEGWKNLSPLAKLKPDDLYSIVIAGSPPQGDVPDDRFMDHLRSLTGLKELHLHYTKVTGNGLRNLSRMKSLECLYMPECVKDSDLAPIMELRSLKRLYFRNNSMFNQGEILMTPAGFSRLAEKLTGLEELELGGGHLDDNALAHLAILRSLRYLSLWGPNLTDNSLVHLKNAPSLRILRIHIGHFTDKGALYLANLSHVENLNLHWMEGITDQGVACLAKMTSLKKLDIYSAKLTDAGLAPLTQNKMLEYLMLPIDLTDNGLAYVSQCRNLKYLWAGGGSEGPFSDAGLKHLVALHDLEFLLIWGSRITDDGIASITELKNLKTLQLYSPNLTDKALTQLANLTSLTELNIRNSGIGSAKESVFSISGLSHLNSLTNLTNLEVNTIAQDDSTLNIGGMKNLERIRIVLKNTRKGGEVIAADKFRDEDLACLAKLSRLKHLQIIDGISDTGMAHLAGLVNMEFLQVGGPSLTDRGLTHLANMKRLNFLDIKGGNITDNGLRLLEGFKSLGTLNIASDNGFSERALQHLKHELPNLYTLSINQSGGGMSFGSMQQSATAGGVRQK